MSEDTKNTENNPINVDRDLSDCLFSQYALTFAAVTTTTGYTLYKKHPNGIALMLVAGAAGSLGDLAYGWNFACRSQVQAWHARNLAELRDKKEE